MLKINIILIVKIFQESHGSYFNSISHHLPNLRRIFLKTQIEDFFGGPVVKNLPSQVGDMV